MTSKLMCYFFSDLNSASIIAIVGVLNSEQYSSRCQGVILGHLSDLLIVDYRLGFCRSMYF